MKGPESYVKKDAVRNLRSLDAYVFAPVQMGIGKATLDLLACVPVTITQAMVGHVIGRFVAVECKASPNKPTVRQQMVMKEIAEAAGLAVWVNEDDVARIGKLTL